jgi:hypothetical protein
MPRNLTFEDAAALPFGGLTSLFFLRDKARIQPGERVLINGASGAVGSAAVQLAKHFGAGVTGVCSAANAQLVRSLGADRVIDYVTEDFTQARETYDIILDAVGNCSFARCKPVLAPGGRLLLVVASLGQLLGSLLWSSRAGRKVLGGVGSVRPADLLLLRDLAESGTFKPVIDRTYEFARIVDAHAHVDTGRKKGNVVITLEQANAPSRAIHGMECRVRGDPWIYFPRRGPRARRLSRARPPAFGLVAFADESRSHAANACSSISRAERVSMAVAASFSGASSRRPFSSRKTPATVRPTRLFPSLKGWFRVIA